MPPSSPQWLPDLWAELADDYDQYAALEQEVCKRLLERVAFRLKEPSLILDLGCGTGMGAEALKREFRKARVIGLDRSPAMLEKCRKRSSFMRPLLRLCTDISELPFPDRCADLVFANLAGQWRMDRRQLFNDIRRVLKPGGMLLFSSFGRATLAGLALETPQGLVTPGWPEFEDIMETGDAMMAAGFREPVMDTDWISLSYPDSAALIRELEATGMANEASEWGGWKQQLLANPELAAPWSRDGKLYVEYEIIYGSAFGPEEGQPRRAEQGEVATFSVDALRKSLKK